jgi:preprotein translocase subunit SecB
MDDCVLKLNALVFDDIIFKRIGIKNENELEISFSVRIGTNMSEENTKKVSVRVLGEKKEEYNFEIQASGYFSYAGSADDAIIQQNAVAIVMPYIRSEVTILTAQPGVDAVVLPPFNIAGMMNKKC